MGRKLTSVKKGYYIAFVPVWARYTSTPLTINKIFKTKTSALRAVKKLKARGDKNIKIKRV